MHSVSRNITIQYPASKDIPAVGTSEGETVGDVVGATVGDAVGASDGTGTMQGMAARERNPLSSAACAM